MNSRITTFYRQTVGHNPLASTLLARIRKDYPDLKDLQIENVFRIESTSSDKKVARLKKVFCYPGAETIGKKSKLSIESAPVIEISYKRAWTDNELQSILHAGEALKVPLLHSCKRGFLYFKKILKKPDAYIAPGFFLQLVEPRRIREHSAESGCAALYCRCREKMPRNQKKSVLGG